MHFLSQFEFTTIVQWSVNMILQQGIRLRLSKMLALNIVAALNVPFIVIERDFFEEIFFIRYIA